jgi:hypothetical protein
VSKILITYFHALIENDVRKTYHFYESLGSALKENGNSVLFYNVAIDGGYWKKDNTVGSAFVIETIKRYAPDLIITFNNQITENCIKNTNCPILVFDADSGNFFVNAGLIKK